MLGIIWATIFSLLLLFPGYVQAQTATYHVHNEASSTSGLLQLKTANPDVATVTLSSANLNGVAVGEYLIKAFDTQSGVPNASGVISSGSTVSFTLWMKKSASTNAGTMFPRGKVYLNSASGTLLCTATGTTAMTTTAVRSTLTCNTTANILMAATDRFYLWVGTNITVKATASVTAQFNIEGTLNGNYDSLITVPLPTAAPSISSLSLSSGQVGTSITLTGNNFRSTQGSSAVKFNGVTATPSSWSNTSIVAPVPGSATTGPVVVTVGGQASNGITFTVLPPPSQISSLSPTFGPIGTVVTITGTNFGATQGSSTVAFNGTAATPSSWGATSIVAPVPPGATTGNVVVTVSGQASNGVSFTMGNVYHLHSEASSTSGLLQLKQASPDVATTNASISMTSKTGDQLIKAFDTQINDPNSIGTIPSGSTLSFTLWMRKSVTAGTMTPRAKLYLNSATGTLLCTATTTTTLAVSTSTPTKYVLTCATTANVTMAVTDRLYLWVGVNISTSTTTAVIAYVHLEGTLNGNYDSYIVAPLPAGLKITALSPTSGSAGTSVMISGTKFGAIQGGSSVTFNGSPAAPTAWSDTSITVPVPAAATTGPVIVTVAGSASNAVTFTVKPQINSLSPTLGTVGTSVTINGASFRTTQGSSTVTFNGAAATPGSWSATTIVVSVPSGATTGSVIVTVGGQASNGVSFTVIPTINNLSLLSAQVGTSVTITGSGFGTTQGGSSVTFNGVAATPSSWSNTIIAAPVPTGATTGPVVVTVGGQASNGITFTVLPPPPQISSLSPTFGPVGTVVTITGTNFGTTQGSSTVAFNGTAATPSSWSTTNVVVPVPPGATTGNVIVTVGGQTSNGVVFRVGDVYHLHSEASSTSGLMQLKQANPDMATTNASISMTSKTGDQLIKAFDTQINDPNSVGTIPSGSTLSFTLWMRKSVTAGTMTPRAKLYLNSATGTLLCTATTTTTLAVSTSTPTKYILTCATTANVTITATDRLYLWVGVNISTSTTTAVTAYVHLEGALNGNYDSYILAPLPAGLKITALSPTSGPAATPVTISGTKFGATQGSSTVAFNGVTANPTAWSDNSITVPVPAGATTGNVIVTVVGIASNGVTFTLTPKIDSLSPNSGTLGTLVNIYGSGFGAVQGSSTITFNGVLALISWYYDTYIVANVPANATTGPVIATVNGVASNGISFTIIPTIYSSITTQSGPVGMTAYIYGTGFGAMQGTSTVKFNGVTSTPSSWSAGYIVTTVPAGATTGPLVVTVEGQAASIAFTVLPTPYISSVSPTVGPPGTTVTLTGTDFGATQGSSTVTFGSLTATPSSWSSTNIVTEVPWFNPDWFGGGIIVTVGGVPSNAVSFTVGDIYHLHSEVSSTSGLMQLKKAGPDAAATSVSVSMTSKTGDQLIKAFNTQLNDPNIAGTISGGATLNFTLWMRKDTSNGAMTPRAKLYLNSATGPLLCTATTTTTLAVSTTAPTKYVLTCITTATVTIAKTDRLYLWVGVNISTSTTSAVSAYVHLEGVLNGNYDSYVVAPVPYQPEITSLSPNSGAITTSVTISGKRFRATQGTSTVEFNGITATPTSWSDTSITVPVPDAATTGPVTVTVSSMASNGMAFTVLLGTPTNLTSIPGDGYIYLHWDIPSGGDASTTYNLYRRTGTSSYTLLSEADFVGVGKDISAQAGVVYEYVVTAIDPSSGNETAHSVETREMWVAPTILKSYNEADVYATAKGDLNGDGLIDFAFARGISSESGNYTQVDIFLGGSTQTTPNYTLPPTLPGYAYSLTMEDLNGDGFADLIVGDPGYSIPGGGSENQFVGKVSIYAGSPQFSANPISTIVGNPDYNTCYQYSGAGQLGYSIASAGDINGDGYLDVVAGSPYYACRSGKVVFIKGGPNLSTLTTTEWVATSGWALTGSTVSGVGDMNGDGYDDILVGAPGYAFSYGLVGHASLILGSASIGPESNFLIFEQGILYDGFGSLVASAGDINGDGFPDMAIVNPFSGEYLYLGSALLPGLTTPPPDMFFQSISSVLNNVYPGAGNIFPAGRLNGDAIDDLVTGSGLNVYFGSSVGENYADIRSAGGPLYDDGRTVLGVVDFNRDGVNEVITTNSASPPTSVRFESLSPYLSLPEIRIQSPMNYSTTFNQTVPLQGTVSSPILNLTIGGQPVTVLSDGTFQTNLLLAKGKNLIEIIGDTSDGRLIKRTLDITFVQTQSLNISIANPANGAVVNNTPFTVTGTVTDLSAQVTINGVAATVSNNNTFTASIELVEGSNTITATATKVFGLTPPAVQTATASVTVTAFVNGTATGRVTDSVTGSPVPGVTVTIRGELIPTTVVTDANGVYSAILPPHQFMVDFSKAGYFTKTSGFTVITGQVVTLNISLIPIPPYTLSITSPQNGAVLNTSSVVVTGQVTGCCYLTVIVNGITVYPIGTTYSVYVPLNLGSNVITASGTDSYGQSASVSITVTRTGNQSVTGTVTDASSGLPILLSASVSITDSIGNSRTALTDVDGRYQVLNLAPGNYTGTITKSGYVPYSLSGVIPASGLTILDTALSPTSSGGGNLTVTNITTNSATIHWITNRLADSRLDYGLAPQVWDYSVNNFDLVTVHNTTLSGLTPNTTYYFRAGSFSSEGYYISSGELSFKTLGPIHLTITSPLNGAVIGKTETSVQGTITGGSGQDMGVTVNGVLASIYGGEFVANHVPLTAGTNTLTVTAKDISGMTATASVTVQSVPAANYITLSANPESGVAPMQTTVTIDSTFTIASSTLYASGPGSAQITGVSLSQFQVNLTTEGIYYFTANVTDGQGVVYTDTFAITALNFTQMDTLLQTKWNGMTVALNAGDMATAMPYFVVESQEKYQAIFQDLLPSLPQLLGSIQALHLLTVGNDEAEMEAIVGGDSYPIIFMRDENGIWKVWGF